MVWRRGERVLIDSANRPNEQLVSQDPFKSDGSQGRTSLEGGPPGAIPTGIHVVATTTLVSIRRANCVCCSSCRPREVSRGAKPCRMDTKTDLRFCEGRRRALHTFCACAFSFGIHSTLFCSSSALARAARGASSIVSSELPR